MVQGKGSQKAYLSSYEHDDVLRIIIDIYRLRVETDHLSREEDHGIYYPGKPIDGLVWAKGDGKYEHVNLDYSIIPGLYLLILIYVHFSCRGFPALPRPRGILTSPTEMVEIRRSNGMPVSRN